MGLRLTSDSIHKVRFDRLKEGAIFIDPYKEVVIKIQAVSVYGQHATLYNAVHLETGTLRYYQDSTEVIVLPVDSNFKVF